MPLKAAGITPLEKYCHANREPSHTQKELTSKSKQPLGKLKKEIAYDPNREERLAVIYARDQQQADITKQRLHMQDAGLLNIPGQRPGFVEDTSPAELERQKKMIEDARGPGYQQQVSARQSQRKLHHQ